MTLYRDREIHPRVKDLQHPRLRKPRRGLQIFDMRVDFLVPVQSRSRFLYCKRLAFLHLRHSLLTFTLRRTKFTFNTKSGKMESCYGNL